MKSFSKIVVVVLIGNFVAMSLFSITLNEVKTVLSSTIKAMNQDEQKIDEKKREVEVKLQQGTSSDDEKNLHEVLATFEAYIQKNKTILQEIEKKIQQ